MTRPAGSVRPPRKRALAAAAHPDGIAAGAAGTVADGTAAGVAARCRTGARVILERVRAARAAAIRGAAPEIRAHGITFLGVTRRVGPEITTAYERGTGKLAGGLRIGRT